MIIYIYSYKDNKQGCFTQPFYDNKKPDDYKTIIDRWLKSKKYELDEKSADLSGLDLYFLGVYNDETGNFTNKLEYLLTFPNYERKIKNDKNEK